MGDEQLLSEALRILDGRGLIAHISAHDKATLFMDCDRDACKRARATITKLEARVDKGNRQA